MITEPTTLSWSPIIVGRHQQSPASGVLQLLRSDFERALPHGLVLTKERVALLLSAGVLSRAKGDAHSGTFTARAVFELPSLSSMSSQTRIENGEGWLWGRQARYGLRRQAEVAGADSARSFPVSRAF